MGAPAPPRTETKVKSRQYCSVCKQHLEMEVVPTGDGEASVTVSGMVEWVGRGQVTVNGGSVSITGSGSTPDPGAAVEDFTLTAEIGSC